MWLKRKIFSHLFLVLWLSLMFCGIAAADNNCLNDDLFGVSFADSSTGWVCGRWGKILHTQNQGCSWVRQHSGVEVALTSIFFVDTLHGWAVGDQGTIITTVDGGQTWYQQDSPVPYYLMKVFFISATEGWAVGEKTAILHTVDGGKNWQLQFSDEDFILKSITFSDPLHGWAVGEYGYIYHTDNGGLSWHKQAGIFDFSEETGEIIGGNFLFDVKAVDEKKVWVVGIDGYVAFTDDGGKNWQQVSGAIPKVHLFSIEANREGKNIVIAGDAVLLSSSDYGKTFHLLAGEPTIAYGWLYEIARRGDRGFVAVGSGQSIYLTDTQAIYWYASVEAFCQSVNDDDIYY
jgi:photosystem II stability/assembly factor-like uncharacterized protein